MTKNQHGASFQLGVRLKNLMEVKMKDNLLEKELDFILDYSPMVIELFFGLKFGQGVDHPIYYSCHLDDLLRNNIIPGKYDGFELRLSENDTEIIKSSLEKIFGNFAFLKKGTSPADAQKTAEALERVAKINWNVPHPNYQMKVLDDSQKQITLKRYLVESLKGSRSDRRSEKEIELLAEYFVIFCGEDKKLLKELALRYYCASVAKDQYSQYLASGD